MSKLGKHFLVCLECLLAVVLLCIIFVSINFILFSYSVCKKMDNISKELDINSNKILDSIKGENYEI